MSDIDNFITMWIDRLMSILLILVFIFVVWFVCFDLPAATPDSLGVWDRGCADYGLAK